MTDERRLQILRDHSSLTPGPDCVSDLTLAKLTRGENEMAAIEHIAYCDWCGERLRDLLHVQEDDLSCEDGALLDSLCPPPAKAREARSVGWNQRTAAIAASFLLVLSLGGWWVWSRSAQRTEGLLAEAYATQRTFAWRLPSSHWSQEKLERGAGSRSLPLIEAEEILKRRSAGAEADAKWLDLNGRLEMLTFQPDAVNTLQRALLLSPKSAEVLGDLGVAYALNAEERSRPSDYGAALDSMTRALAIHDSARTRFNRALAFEKLGMVEQAIADWEIYLREEPDSGWRSEASKRLEALKETHRRRSRLLKSTPESDAALESAAVEWLQRDRERAAQVGRRLKSTYGDSWLWDAELEPVDSAPLLRAVSLTAAGNAVDALPVSKAATQEYHRQGAKAHEARAELTSIFALNRLSESQACVTQSGALIRDLTNTSYYWIRIMAEMYLASCLDMEGSPGQALAVYQEALGDARRYRIEGLELRAVGTLSNARIEGGNIWAAWYENREAMMRLAESPYTTNRIQQCLVNYADAAEKRGWLAAAAVFMVAASDLVASTGNGPTEAACRARAALLASRCELNAEAERQSAQARALFQAMAPSGMRTQYMNSVALLQAESLLQQGRAAAAAELLSPLERDLQMSQDQWQFRWLMGAAFLKLGRRDEARNYLEEAVRENEARVRSLGDLVDKVEARREGRDAYRELARLYVDRGEQEKALKVWMAAHSSSTRADLIFLSLRDGYACWRRRDSRVSEYLRLHIDRAKLAAESRELLNCASRSTGRMDEIRRLGREIYEDLLAPLGPQPHELTILPDGEITAIPFAALSDGSGRWFLSQHSLVIAKERRPASKIKCPRSLVAGDASGDALPDIEEFPREERAVRLLAGDVRVLKGADARMSDVSAALSGAELFHFAGHGFDSAGSGGLYLADGALTSESIRRLRLKGCKLAVLSACMSASGEAEGFANRNSLVRSLLDAGAETVMASLWPVDSAATAHLTEKFYEGIASGASPEAALASASVKLASDAKFAHPYYWAAFQIYR